MADDDQTDEQQSEAGDKPTEQPPQDWQKEAEKWKALARKHEGTAKSNADAAKRLADIEEASKSEQQKATDAANAAADRADKAERELLRIRVATEKGLTLAQSRRLVGATEEELRTDADALLDDLKPSSAPATRKPQERLRGGSEPDEPVEEMDSIRSAR
jgi:hypothetical protein